jgi:hypothetical protein
MTEEKQLELINEINENVEAALLYMQENWAEADEDTDFRLGDQWPPELAAKKVKLTNNLVHVFIKQVVNEARQNRPQVKVFPVDGDGDRDIAEIYEAIIRNVERNSNSETAFDCAFDQAVTGSLGYFKINVKWADEESWDQDIVVERINDYKSILFDPSSREFDNSDARWYFERIVIARKEFKELYPDSNDKGFSTQGYDLNKDDLIIGKYWRVEEENDWLYYLIDETSVKKSELPEDFDKTLIVDKRRIKNKKVRWYLCTPFEILEDGDWMGKFIPIIPVFGDEVFRDGKRKFISLIRYAKDPQRALNYWETAAAENVALNPKPPVIGYEGQFAGHEKKWGTANQVPYSYLEIKPVYDQNGNLLPAPIFKPAPDVPAGMVNAANTARENLKLTIGINDAGLGIQQRVESGEAILNRKIESDTSMFGFLDNLSRSLRFYGRALIDLIPRIYSDQKIVRIMGEDGAEKVVKINAINESGKVLSLDQGKYDVDISVGPSHTTQRKEAAKALMTYLQADPESASAIRDLVAKFQDWPGAQEIAERLRRTIDPAILGDDEKDQSAEQALAVAQNQLSQLQQVNQQLEAQLKQAIDYIQGQQAQAQARIEQERIKQETALATAQIKKSETLERQQMQNDGDIAQAILAEMAKLRDQQAELMKYVQTKSAQPNLKVEIESEGEENEPEDESENQESRKE